MPNFNRLYIGLRDAAYALEEQAAGRTPELSRLLSGTITLDTLFRRRSLDPDLQDAALGLEQLAREGSYYLDSQGRKRAAALAAKVSDLAEMYARDGTGPNGRVRCVARQVR